MRKVLRDIGLSKNEAISYLALAELGMATVKEVSTNTSIHRSNVYEALRRLGEKGMVSEIMQEGKKHYSANNPESLLNFVDNKKSQLQEIIPDLKRLVKETRSQHENVVEVYQGTQGLKHILDVMLHTGKTIYAFGIPDNSYETMKYFISNFHDERIQRKIPIYHLYDEDAPDRIKYLNSLPLTSAKKFKMSFQSPATTTIFGDYVTIWIWSKPEFCLLIKSKPMAESYKNYFDVLWSMK